ncbi:MAG: alpha/beta hydrolase [Saprospiraceae bacterium]|nr:alpha/beta hydrolase [Saprospiraceae bacterium]
MRNRLFLTLLGFALAAGISAQTTGEQIFSKLTLAQLNKISLAPERLGNLKEGDIIVYETNKHRKGKVLVRKNGQDLVVDWITYLDDGQPYRSGRNTTIRGTYRLDLDDMSKGDRDFDVWWQIVNDQNRYLAPQNGALLGIYRETSADDVVQPENDGNMYPFPLRKIKLANQVEIAYVDEGQGNTTLLFIHGLGGYHQVWKKNIEDLSRNYRCVAIDLPGCGQSSRGDYSYSIAFYAEVVNAFIREKQLKNVVLVGHSLGGQVVVLTALKNNPDVVAAILLAPSGLQILSPGEKMALDWLAQPEKIKNRSDRELKKAFEAGYAKGKIPSDAMFMLQYRLKLRNRPEYFDYFCQMMYQLNMAAVNEPVLDRLNLVPVPVLVLWGKEDGQLPPRLVKEAKQHIPKCETRILSPCGHMLQWECYNEVNVAIDEFVKLQPRPKK